MANTLLLKVTYSCSQQRHRFLSLLILNSQPNFCTILTASETMAVPSSFSPRLPSHFRHRSRHISSFSTKPQFFVSLKSFSSQTDTSIIKDNMPAQVGFLGLGIMGSPMAENLIKAGLQITFHDELSMRNTSLLFLYGSEKYDELDPSILVEVVSQGAISAPMYSTKCPSMVQSLYPTAFPLKHQQKDLRLALSLAETVSQPTPIVAAANELYKVAKSRGLSD